MTNREAILLSALLCGMRPSIDSIHRFQLFYVVHGWLRRRSGVNDLQRTLETAADEGLFEPILEASSNKRCGRYYLTDKGGKEAIQCHGTQTPIMNPAAEGECCYTVESPDDLSYHLRLTVNDGTIEIYHESEKRTGTYVIDWLNKNTKAGITISRDSCARRVYDFAIKQGWSICWNGAGVNIGGDTTDLIQQYSMPSDDPNVLQDRVSKLTKLRSRFSEIPIPSGTIRPKNIESISNRFQRSPAVVEYVLSRSKGRCEYCLEVPFLTDSGRPFLEVHHLKTLAEGGPDVVTNAVALCPTCHRSMHYAMDRESYKEELYSRIPQLIKC